MKYIKNYELYKASSLNEEFVGSVVKGALSNLFQAFSSPFKNLSDDIKKSFKDDDPNSIKGVVMTNFNQAIDNAQKLIRDKNLQEGDVLNIMTTFISSLTELANGIGKDISSAIDDKKQASAANEIAKAILLGNKESQWKGIIGFLNDPSYKFSKPSYEKVLTEASSNKSGIESLKAKQDASYKFFDSFQKEITNQLNKDLTEEEMKKIYDDVINKGGGHITKYNYQQLKDFFDKKIKVMYKKDNFDSSKNLDEQKENVGIKLMDSVDDQGNVTFKSEDGSTSFKKKYSDILGPAGKDEDKAATELKQELTKIKNDGRKLDAVRKFTQFIQSGDKNKISEIQNIINPQDDKSSN